MLSGFDELIERRIQQAAARGEFDHLPGAGRPLRFDDDPLVPPEMRMANRILKNAGCIPPELEHLKEVDQLLARLTRAELGDAEQVHATRRLRALLIQVELGGRPATAAAAWQQYNERLLRRFEAPADGA